MDNPYCMFCCFQVSYYHWDCSYVILRGFVLFNYIKSCSLELDLNKLGLLSVALWTNGSSAHGSRYPGRWPGKRIFSPQADHTGPLGWGGLWHDEPPPCPCAASEHSSFFHFISVPIASFFFFAWRVIIQHFSRATICDPAEGPGQFPRTHGHDWCSECSHARTRV